MQEDGHVSRTTNHGARKGHEGSGAVVVLDSGGVNIVVTKSIVGDYFQRYRQPIDDLIDMELVRIDIKNKIPPVSEGGVVLEWPRSCSVEPWTM